MLRTYPQSVTKLLSDTKDRNITFSYILMITYVSLLGYQILIPTSLYKLHQPVFFARQSTAVPAPRV
jgi:hypothetical protein